MDIKVVIILLLILHRPSCHVHGFVSISKERRFGKLTTAISGNVLQSYKILVNTIRAIQPEFQKEADLHNIPRLRRQLAKQAPPNWIPIELVGRRNQKIEIALRSDNLYLVGFKNKEGKWYELQSDAGQLIPDSTLLPFGGSYADLLGPGGKKKLEGINMGKDTLVDAIEVIFSYPSIFSVDELKKEIAIVIVMIVEAARLNPIRNRIFNSWPHGVIVDKQFTKYTVLWCSLSMFILCDAYGYSWTYNPGINELKGAGITTAKQASDSVNIILVPTVFDQNNLAYSCTLPCRSSIN